MSEIIIHVQDSEMLGVLGIHPALELITDVWRHHREVTMSVGIIELQRFLLENPKLAFCIRIPTPYAEEELHKYAYRTIALAQVREIIRADAINAYASTLYLKCGSSKRRVRYLSFRGLPDSFVNTLLAEMCAYLIGFGFGDVISGIRASKRNKPLLNYAVAYYAAFKLYDSSKNYIIV